MNKQLILIRHSLPEIDKDRPAREWNLSEEGRTRAERFTGSLIGYHPQELFSSPEPKAMETAEIIAQKIQLPVNVIEDLHEHERNNVPYLSDFNSVVNEFFEKPDRIVFGTETADQAYERFSRAVYSALTGNKSGTTVIVSHGTVISLFVARLTDRRAFEIWSGLGLPGYFVLDLQSKHLVASENNFNIVALPRL